jgi:drug/metabolite transporter (DMT)-like permease
VVASLAIGAVAISFAAPLFRRAAPIDPLLASAARLALAALLLAPSIPPARAAGKLGPRARRAALVGGALYAVHFGTWVASLGLTTVAASVTLVTATPLLLAVIGATAGKDAPGRRLWAAVGLAAAGTVAIGLSDAGLGGAATTTEGALLGDGLALAGAAAMALYLLVVRAWHADLEAASFSCLAAGAAALLLGAAILLRGLATGAWPDLPSLDSLGWVALTAVLSQLVGHTSLTWALAHASPTAVGLATTTEPVVASLVTWAWLGEVPAPLVIVGSLVTVAGVALGLGTAGRATTPSGRSRDEPLSPARRT